MKWRNASVLFLIFALIFTNCRKDFDFEPAAQNFKFSRDTVYLDTVFTTVRSETYSVKVYNHQDEDVVIPRIYLEEGLASYYRINVDGAPGVSAENVPIRAKDSLYIFVEIAPTENLPNETLVVENLNITHLNGEQTVKLVSLVEDADFYYPQAGNNETVITEDTQWNDDKSKVIFGNLRLAPGKTLTVNQGTHVYFSKESRLIIDENSSLLVNGQLNEEVEFRGARHDLRHDTLPANWDGIKLLPNATASFNYAKIKGGITAIEMYQSVLTINNSMIHNFVNAGIVAIDAEVSGSNLLMNNFGNAAVALLAGGDYQFEQCTFANYFELGVGNAYSVYLSNEYEDGNGNTISGVFDEALFGNCILYNDGFNSIEVSDATNYQFDHCLIKYTNNSSGLNPETNPLFTNCWLNEDPEFIDTRASVNNLTVSNNSFARNKGASVYAQSFPFDYFGVMRSNSPTLGAIE